MPSGVLPAITRGCLWIVRNATNDSRGWAIAQWGRLVRAFCLITNTFMQSGCVTSVRHSDLMDVFLMWHLHSGITIVIT